MENLSYQDKIFLNGLFFRRMVSIILENSNKDIKEDNK